LCQKCSADLWRIYGTITACFYKCQAVGNALHKNPDFENIPCYRVVNSKGELAGEYAFGGEWAQKELLEADEIEVIDGKVDLAKYAVKINKETI